MGSFGWTGFDYRGETSPTRWPSISSHFGNIDLSGFPKDSMYYFQAMWFPNQPLVHITPQNFNLPPESDTFVSACSEGASTWKFGNGAYPQGSYIQSIDKPGYCLQGNPGSSPGQLAKCDPSNPSFLFFKDQYNQIYFMSNGGKQCLDITDGEGPSVGFWPCKDQTGTNQIWSFDNKTMLIKSNFFQGECLATGTQVYVYTNGDSIELYLNGALVGKQSISPFEIGEFVLPSAAGNLTAVVQKNGVDWGFQTIRTTMAPVKLVLTMERPRNSLEPIINDGQDVALLRVSAVDANGQIVRSATNLITFEISSNNGIGKIVGTGNGNPSDHYPDQGNKRPLWNGYAAVLVGTTNSGSVGGIIVTASTPGLQSSQFMINTKLKSFEQQI